MTPAPPIKRHEVFLIIALLFLNLSYVVKDDWLGLALACMAAGTIIAFFVELFGDKI